MGWRIVYGNAGSGYSYREHGEEMKLWHAPPGKLIRGHVLDVAVGPFTQALHELDKQLYVKWNPFKLRGFGCWEIRRKPNRKVAVFKGTFEGADYYNLEYVENNFYMPHP